MGFVFTFTLQNEDGTPADPPTLKTAVPDWHQGDTIPRDDGKTLRMVEVQPARAADDDPVLVVIEDERFKF
jgi:hypothetical protein